MFEGKPFIIRYANGHKMMEGMIINDEYEGLYTFYYPSGQKGEEGHHIKGKKQGKWTKWKEDGQIESVKYYENGKIINPVKEDSSSGDE